MSTDTIAAAISESGATRTPIRISGRSNWLDAGRPVRAAKDLSLRDDTGVVSYVPGDLTLTVRAGTTLGEIERVTLEHDQWLPLDPYGSSDGTIGATIATASAGPLAASFGLPRDVVLGLEFVNGRGEVIRGGGKVVKNVAGFDLSRLLTGSWGSLGVITEVTLRLYARPQVDRTFAVPMTGTGEQAKARALATYSELSPFALLFVGLSESRVLGLGEKHPVCLIRLGGNDAVVTAQMLALSQIGQLQEVESRIWASLRALEVNADSVVRISDLPSHFFAASASILNDDLQGVYTCIDPRRGVMRVVVAANGENERADVTSAGASVDFTSGGSSQVIFEKLPPDVWAQVSPSVVADPLSQRIRKAYDPHNILNPGILGD